MPKPEGWDDINALPDSVEVITCPNCGTGTGLEFFPMLENKVYAQCRCGFGWDMQGHLGKAWVN